MAKSYISHYRPAEDKALELCEGLKTEQEKFDAITAWLTKYIVYDYVRASMFREVMGPDVERCFDQRMGICLDIAALTACMFRAVGMWANVAIGSCTSIYKNGDNEYRQKPVKHAWNEIVVNGRWITWDQMIAQKNRNSNKSVWTAMYKVSHVRK